MTQWLSNRRAQSGRGICEGCDLFSFLEHDPDKVGVGTGGGVPWSRLLVGRAGGSHPLSVCPGPHYKLGFRRFAALLTSWRAVIWVPAVFSSAPCVSASCRRSLGTLSKREKQRLLCCPPAGRQMDQWGHTYPTRCRIVASFFSPPQKPERLSPPRPAPISLKRWVETGQKYITHHTGTLRSTDTLNVWTSQSCVSPTVLTLKRGHVTDSDRKRR